MTGEFETGREHCAEARAILEELGQAASATHCSAVLGDLELLAGDPDAARREFELLCRFCEENEEHGMLSTYATDLAEALYRLDEIDLAEHFRSAPKLGIRLCEFLGKSLNRVRAHSRFHVAAGRGVPWGQGYP